MTDPRPFGADAPVEHQVLLPELSRCWTGAPECSLASRCHDLDKPFATWRL